MSDPSRIRVLAIAGAICLALQFASIAWYAPPPGSPNAATVLAEGLVRDGTYLARAWPTDLDADGELRAYLLPAEALYLAAAFRWLPEGLWPYLHVPVTLLLVLAISAAGLAIGGPRLGLAAGVLAGVDPFVVAHGPVWDDTFLAAALEWSLFATLLTAIARPGCRAGLGRPMPMVAISLIAACAALTRMPSQLFLVAAALAVVPVVADRHMRRLCAALVIGTVIGIGAWGARNHLVLGEFFIGTSHDGITLLESTSDGAWPSIVATGTAEGFASSALAEHYEAARSLSELEADRYFRAQAWEHIRRSPIQTSVTGLLKTVVSILGVDLGVPLSSPRNIVAVVWNTLLWGLAFAGFFRWRRLGRTPQLSAAGWMLTVILGVTVVLLVVGPVGARYRITLTGAAYVLAAGALTSRLRPGSADDGPRARPPAVKTPPRPNDSVTA